jgi:hypothetical protein
MREPYAAQRPLLEAQKFVQVIGRACEQSRQAELSLVAGLCTFDQLKPRRS